MGFFNFFKPGGDTVKGALEGAGELAKDLRVAISGKDPEHAVMLKELETKVMLAQAEITKQEASHKSVFVAGWRPFIGWTCGAAIAYHYILFPLGDWISQLAGSTLEFPPIAMAELFPLVIALIGMGALRTAEKAGSYQNNH